MTGQSQILNGRPFFLMPTKRRRVVIYTQRRTVLALGAHGHGRTESVFAGSFHRTAIPAG
jgi:hypothetical protein